MVLFPSSRLGSAKRSDGKGLLFSNRFCSDSDGTGNFLVTFCLGNSDTCGLDAVVSVSCPPGKEMRSGRESICFLSLKWNVRSLDFKKIPFSLFKKKKHLSHNPVIIFLSNSLRGHVVNDTHLHSLPLFFSGSFSGLIYIAVQVGNLFVHLISYPSPFQNKCHILFPVLLWGPY